MRDCAEITHYSPRLWTETTQSIGLRYLPI